MPTKVRQNDGYAGYAGASIIYVTDTCSMSRGHVGNPQATLKLSDWGPSSEVSNCAPL